MSMFSTGILVLSSPLHALPHRIAPILNLAAKVVEHTLYVHFHPGLNLTGIIPPQPVFISPLVDVYSLITRLYSNAADVCGHLDIRVLLTNVEIQSNPSKPGQATAVTVMLTPQSLTHLPEVVLTDFPIQEPEQSTLVAQLLQRYASQCYVCSPGIVSVLLDHKLEKLHEEWLAQQEVINYCPVNMESLATYSDVVVGGTFDRLHGAHKTLLNISCLIAQKRFLIGVCDQDLLKRKVLKELIEPYAVRVQRLREFLNDVKPLLQYEIVPLLDPFGPSVYDVHLKCIVVSEETRKGGEAVNKKRIENGLPCLVLHEIKLLKDAQHSETEEEKISSSSLRSRLLGTVIAAPKANSHLPPLPYVIGLTGTSASGKSSIAKHLESLGAACIDCDKLGHETYRPGTNAYNRLLKEFGSDILNDDGTIHRRVLGRKVFGDKERLKALTDIVWPDIAVLVKGRIQQAREEGKQVFVIDAAVLLEAGWTDFIHEVWVAVIPEDEAVLRIINRDRVTEAEALRRLHSQFSIARLVEQANVVLCTLWEPEITYKQVLKAWNLLQERILGRIEAEPLPQKTT